MTLTPAGNFTGIAHVTVTAWDGPSGERDWRGRSASQNFDLSVGTAAVYGTVYDDANENQKQDVGEPGEPFFQVFLDVNNDGVPGPGDIGPVTANYEGISGNYALVGLPAGAKGTVRIQAPNSATGGVDGDWALLSPVSGYAITTGLTAGQVVQGDSFAEYLTIAPLASQLPSSAPEGTTINLTISAQDPFSGTGHHFIYTWAVTLNGNPYGTAGNAAAYNFSLTNAGTYAVTVAVQELDPSNNVLGSYAQTAALTCTAAPPTNVSAGTSYTIGEGSLLTLSASASNPIGSASPLTYSWDVNGDGTFGDATGANPTLTWAQLNALGILKGPGTYQTRVRATTVDGLSATSASVTLTIVNLQPINVSAGGPYTVNEGGSLALSAAAGDPSGITSQLTYSWDVNGDGVFGDAIGANPQLTWAQLSTLGIVQGPAARTVTVRVTDSGGLSTTATAALTINNLAPNVVAGGPYTINEGSPLTLSATAGDPSGNASQLTYRWDVNGDGVFGDATGASPTLTWAQLNALGITKGPATYQVKVQATDSGGLSATSSAATLAIDDLAPINVSAGSGYTIDEGSSLTLSASAGDPSGNTSQLTFSWDVNGDGVFGDATGANPTLTWAQFSGLGIAQGPAACQVEVQATDSGGLSAVSAAATLTVDDLPPANVNAGGPYVVSEGSPLTLSATASDPSGNSGQLIYAWDINGDGIFGDATGPNPTLTWARSECLGDRPGRHGLPGRGPSDRPGRRLDDLHERAVDDRERGAEQRLGGRALQSRFRAVAQPQRRVDSACGRRRSRDLPLEFQRERPVRQRQGPESDARLAATRRGGPRRQRDLVQRRRGGGQQRLGIGGDVRASALTVIYQPPTVAAGASAAPNVVAGTTTSLSVQAADETGESNLTYTWAAATLPGGAAAPTFSRNARNAAKNTTATFSQAGDYRLTVTITDRGGLAATSSVDVTVSPTWTSVTMTPARVTLYENQPQQFTATACDQFGMALSAAAHVHLDDHRRQHNDGWPVDGEGRTATGSVTAASGTNTWASQVTVTNRVSAATTVTSSSSSSARGQLVTFTATVAPSSGSGATGTVQFQIDGIIAGSPVNLGADTGTATYSTSTLSVRQPFGRGRL